MRLYENAPESCYAELKTFYPAWYGGIREMDAIWYVMGDLLDGVRREITRAVDNNFINRADEETLLRLEAFLQLPPVRSVDERRRMIASLLMGGGHIGEREILELVRRFTEGDVSVAFAGGVIRIWIVPSPDDRFSITGCA